MSKQTELLNLTDGLSVDASGNVGIGTAAAADYKLDVNGAFTVGGDYNVGTSTNGGGVNIGFNTTTGGNITALNPAVSWYPLALGASELSFGTFGVDYMRLDGGGSLVFSNHKIHRRIMAPYNVTIDTGISVNGGHTGKTLLVLMTGHTSSGMVTQSSLNLVRCGYNGDNVPVTYVLGGNMGLTAGKSANNTVTLYSASIPTYQIIELSGNIG